jgi:hypothetical protein
MARTPRPWRGAGMAARDTPLWCVQDAKGEYVFGPRVLERVRVPRVSDAKVATACDERIMKVSPHARKSPEPGMLVNIPALITAYYAEVPDPAIPAQRVAFGTSGHRGSALEADALYELLEREVIPEFYTRDENRIPTAWVKRMRESMAQLTPRFSANRTVREYTEQHYLPAAATYRERATDKGGSGQAGRQLAAHPGTEMGGTTLR